MKATFLASKACNLVTKLCTVPDITYQYPTNLVISSVTKFHGIVVLRLSWHLQSFLSFLGIYRAENNDWMLAGQDGRAKEIRKRMPVTYNAIGKRNLFSWYKRIGRHSRFQKANWFAKNSFLYCFKYRVNPRYAAGRYYRPIDKHLDLPRPI